MNVYLAGPMTGVPFFNAPNFKAAAKSLRDAGHCVFSPVDSNEEKFGPSFHEDCPNGDPKEADALGFNFREAFLEDLTYICLKADAIALLPGWRNSTGARAEYATAEVFRLTVIELTT